MAQSKSSGGSGDIMTWGLLALIAYLIYENVMVNSSVASTVNNQVNPGPVNYVSPTSYPASCQS